MGRLPSGRASYTRPPPQTGSSPLGWNDDDADLYERRRPADPLPVRRWPSLHLAHPAQAISFPSAYAGGSVVIDHKGRQLFLSRRSSTALRYPISVGREGFTWNGTEKISRMAEWPDWHPPAEMRERDPSLPEKMTRRHQQPARRQGALSRQHALPHPRHQRRQVDRTSRIVGLLPHAQRTCRRSREPRRGRHAGDGGEPAAGKLDEPSPSRCARPRACRRARRPDVLNRTDYGVGRRYWPQRSPSGIAYPSPPDDTIEQAWAELKKLPQDEQEIAAAAILDYAAGSGRPRLTDDQVAEVARRLADPSPTFATLAEVRAHFRRPAS